MIKGQEYCSIEHEERHRPHEQAGERAALLHEKPATEQMSEEEKRTASILKAKKRFEISNPRESMEIAVMNGWILQFEQTDERGIPKPVRLSDYMPRLDKGRWRRILGRLLLGLRVVAKNRIEIAYQTIAWRIRYFLKQKER